MKPKPKSWLQNDIGSHFNSGLSTCSAPNFADVKETLVQFGNIL